MNLKWIVGFLVALVVILGVGEYLLVTKAPTQTAGAVSAIQSPLCLNGVCEYYISQSFRLGTSTACDIITPNATTSLGQLSAFIGTSLSYAQAYEWGYSQTRNATTTAIVASYTVGANVAAGIVINATTTATLPLDKLLPPNSNLVFNLSTSTASGLNQATGLCEARFTNTNGNGTSFGN